MEEKHVLLVEVGKDGLCKGMTAEELAKVWEECSDKPRSEWRTDTDIRILCLDMSKGGAFGVPDLKKAQEYYDFICPSPKQEEQRM